MKLFEQELKEKTELNVRKQQEKKFVLEGTIKPKAGQRIWELNEETGDIKEAKYFPLPAIFNGLKSFYHVSSKLLIKPNCIYIPALNIENAKKKYLKNKKQSFYFTKNAPSDLSDITTFKV